MEKFIPQPYKLFNKIQNYEWGTKNENAFIPKFLGIEAEPDLPYAELWIGAHPKAPSEIEIDGKKIPLSKVIEKYPRECLGNYVSKKFNGQFPFLFKILSAANALSIQTHPNKIQAKKLHAKDPQNYPDDNHKPEIAIAIDSLTVIAGFRQTTEIVEILRELTELREYAGSSIIDSIINSKDEKKIEMLIKELYCRIMKTAEDKEKLAFCINKIVERLSFKKNLSPEESQFLKQHKLFGTDVGLLSFFFFNLVKLKQRQAIFTDAGVPHAYIKGNIIECMANSDNVVRAGLTNKYKDVDTLLEILRYEFRKYDIINYEQNSGDVTFKTSAEEFEVSSHQKEDKFEKTCLSNDKPSVYLIYEGVLNIEWNSGQKTSFQKFSRGESIFIPAFLGQYRISSEAAVNYFTVEIP